MNTIILPKCRRRPSNRRTGWRTDERTDSMRAMEKIFRPSQEDFEAKLRVKVPIHDSISLQKCEDDALNAHDDEEDEKKAASAAEI